MGDAVRRVQRHLQDLSRDHLQNVEERHHANLAWLQNELQQLCKQIEVDVRVELTRPLTSRASLSQPARRSLAKLQEEENAAPNSTTAATERHESAAEPEPAAAAAAVAVPTDGPVAVTRVVKKTVTKTRKVLRPKIVVELKAELKKRGLKTGGLKAVLAERLLIALAEEDATDEQDTASEEEVEVEEEVLEEVEEEYEEEVEVVIPESELEIEQQVVHGR
ncbi:hypothetical protein ATCC90586_010295 [Pythium insidiosum]|nr:hypothetical protein ATCC90586_010295 [Pythium insidiosum]